MIQDLGERGCSELVVRSGQVHGTLLFTFFIDEKRVCAPTPPGSAPVRAELMSTGREVSVSEEVGGAG